MRGFTFKIGEREDWRCGFCCHVRTATIFLGVWHLMLHILNLSMMAVLLQHPELMNNQMSPTSGGLPKTGLDPPIFVSTAQSQLDNEMTETKLNSAIDHANYVNKNLEYERMNVKVVVILATLVITLMLVYGAVKGKPSYLMPFFCLQLFDLCIASLTAMSSICYLPDMHRVIQENPRIPMQPYLLKLSPHLLAFVVLIVFTTVMIVKAYLVGVVWACYRYLTLRSMAAAQTVHFISESTPPDIQDLLPDYETACTKYPAPQPPPPPSYSQAVATAPLPHPMAGPSPQNIK